MVNASPVAEVYAQLASLDASWSVDVGRPAGDGWIPGDAFRDATTGPFNELLARIGRRMNTTDRLTIAASFALRYGWSSSMAIAPYLRYGCVPDVALDNIALQFREAAFYERTAVYEPHGIVVAGDPRAMHPSMATVPDEHALLRALRAALVDQSTAIVQALHEWSGFAERATWGLLTSSWAAHFTGFWPDRNNQSSLAPILDAFFAGDDVVAQMQPRMNPVEFGRAVHLYQRRASCCRFYRLPGYGLCASCPLVSDDERLTRNREWMRKRGIT